jgi:hypothetical protein
MSMAADTASKASVNFASRSRRVGEDGVSVADQVSEPVGPLAEVGQEVSGQLGRPGRGRVLGDPEDVYASGAEFQDEGHVQPFERDCLDLEKVGGQDR